MSKIYKLGESVLREKAIEIQSFDQELKLLVESMYDLTIKSDGIGLAAPQIGLNKRLFVVVLDGLKLAFINPQIIYTSEDIVGYEEGCLSIPGVYCSVNRPRKVTIAYQDENGKRKTLEADDLLARVIQHENDHLNGVLFIDHLDKETNNLMIEKFNRLERRRNKWKRK